MCCTGCLQEPTTSVKKTTNKKSANNILRMPHKIITIKLRVIITQIATVNHNNYNVGKITYRK